MNQEQLRAAVICHACNKPFGHTGLPLFWRVTFERHGVDARAIQRLDGLRTYFGGNGALASLFSPDNEFTRPMMEPRTITVCESCMTDKPRLLAALVPEDDEADETETETQG